MVKLFTQPKKLPRTPTCYSSSKGYGRNETLWPNPNRRTAGRKSEYSRKMVKNTL